MLLSLLTLFFHCGLLSSGNCEKEHEHKARRNDNFMNDNITDVLLNRAPGTVQTNQVTHQHSYLTNPLGNETYAHDIDPASLAIHSFQVPDYPTMSTSPKVKPKHSQDPGLISASNISEDVIHPTYYTPSPTGPKGTSISSPDVAALHITVHPTVFRPTVRSETTVDLSVEEHAKKWLQVIATSTADTTKLLVPKSGQNFDHDYSTDEFPLANKRNQKTTQRKIGYRQFENHRFRPQKRPIVRQRTTVPHISERRNLEPEAKTSWHDRARESTESDSHRIEGTQTLTTGTKQRLKPNLLLGMATMRTDRNPDDNGEFKKITSGSDENKRILRVHDLPSMKKKKCYSEEQSEQMGAAEQTTHKHIVRHTIFPAPTTCSYMKTASTTISYMKTSSTTQSHLNTSATTQSHLNTSSTTQSHHKIKEFRQESHMITFLLELTRLLAKKENSAVYEVVKHTDQIIRGLYKNRQLQWFGQPLKDVTKKLARSLKESEIDVTKKQAADLHHMLSQRRQMLSEEVNTILECAEKLYDDDEGVKLLEVLKEFGAYPNVTLNGYWLCNSLINNFLRPYRHSKHTRQRQKLIDSVNKALKARFALD